MNIMKKIALGLLVLCMSLSFFACDGGEKKPAETNGFETKVETKAQTDAETEKKAAFKVTVKDEAGNPVSGVMLQICKDACVPARTDESGVATFNIEITDGYKLSVMSCPEGYEYTGEAEVYLENGATEYTLQLSEVK